MPVRPAGPTNLIPPTANLLSDPHNCRVAGATYENSIYSFTIFQYSIIMKTKLIILGLTLLPVIMYAQNQVKCRDTTEISKELYDKFTSSRDGLANIDQEISKDQGILKDIQKRYLGCEELANVVAMRKEAEEALNGAETNRKPLAETFDKVDHDVRDIIRDARGKPVACVFLDRWSGRWGQIVTVLFTMDKGQVTTKPFYSPLPDPNATNNLTSLLSGTRP